MGIYSFGTGAGENGDGVLTVLHLQTTSLSVQTAVTVKIDTMAPTVSVTAVTQGATYTLGSVPSAGCTTTDALSGVAKVATLGVTGGATNRVGTFTATCSGASDKAGNTASASATYTVVYNFRGFFAPVDNMPKFNNTVAGLPIPMIFSLNGAQGLNIFASGYPKSQAITCGSTNLVDGNEATAPISPGGFVYVPGVSRYIYLWQTKRAWAGTCRQFVMKLNDGTLHRANFRFVK